MRLIRLYLRFFGQFTLLVLHLVFLKYELENRAS